MIIIQLKNSSFPKYPVLWKNLTNTSDKIAMSFIRMLRLGPLVSFKGSPTVSPITAAYK